MNDSPPLVGRHREAPRGLPIGQAVPLSFKRPLDENDEHRVPKTADELRADREEQRDAQPLVTGCGFCPWTFEGTAGEGRDAARVHRETEHPQAKNRLGRRRSRMGAPKRRGGSDDAAIAAEAVEARRVRAEREDDERLAKIERGRQRDALDAMGAGGSQLSNDREEEQASLSLDEEIADTPAGVSTPPRDITETRPNPITEEDRMHGNAHESPAKTRWPRVEIIRAIRAHAMRTGFVPWQMEWSGRSNDDRPNYSVVTAEFGNWGNAIEAAGFPRPRRGGDRIPFASLNGSGRGPQAVDDHSGVPDAPVEAPVSPPAAPTAEEASRPENELPAAYTRALIAGFRAFADTLEQETA